MTGLVGKATLLCVCGLVVAGAAMASVPDPAHSSITSVINVVGRNGSGVDSYGTFTVTIKDFSGAAIANVDVKWDFTNCTDGTLCLDAVTGGGTYDCSGSNKEVHATTNLAGQATITIQGGRKAAAPTCLSATCSPPGPGAGCVQVFANGVPMGNASALYVNQKFTDHSNVNGSDTSVMQQEVVIAGLGGPYRARHDLAFSGSINGADTSVEQAQVVRAGLGTGSSIGCTSICPN